MNNITESVLVESRSARSLHLSNLSNDRAIELLDKAKALVMAFRQGTGIATNAQLAEYYEISEEVIRQSYYRNREEFEQDGVKVLKGKDLKSVCDIQSQTSHVNRLTAWTPRGALRLGMLLRDSLVARNVRSVILDIVEDKKPDPKIELDWGGLIETLESKITQIVRRELSTQYQRGIDYTAPFLKKEELVTLDLSALKQEQLTQAFTEVMEIRDRWCEKLGIQKVTIGDNCFCEAVRNGKVPEIDRLLPIIKWGTSNGISRGSLTRIRKRLANNTEIRSLDRPKTKLIDSHPELESWVRAQRAAFPQEAVAGLHRRMQLQHPEISVSITTLSRWLESEGLG